MPSSGRMCMGAARFLGLLVVVAEAYDPVGDQPSVRKRHVGHEDTRRHRVQRDAPNELTDGVDEVDLRESRHRVGTVARDERRPDVAELSGSLSPPSDRTDQRPVRPDHQDVIGLAVEDVQVGLGVEVHRANVAEGVPVVAHGGPDGEDLLGRGVHDHVRAVQGAAGAGVRSVPRIAAGRQEREQSVDKAARAPRAARRRAGKARRRGNSSAIRPRSNAERSLGVAKCIADIT